MTSAEKKLRAIRDGNERIHQARKKEIYEKFPRYREIEEEERKNGFDLIRHIIESKPIELVRERGEALQEEKARILAEAGYPQTYLDPIYTCPICKDTGADGTKICTCKKNLIISELYSMSGIEEIIEYQNFDNFNLDIFRAEAKAGEGLSPRQVMEFYLANAKAYSQAYPQVEDKNIYIYGPVGTGKTYMCNAIAKTLLDRGISVVYQTAGKLMNFIADYNFADRTKKEDLAPKYAFLTDADLLIIDDLGTEISSSVTDSHLFDLINERIINDKGTIISSNLDINGLRSAYDERIYSRILGKYKPVNFYGDDLRTRKYR